MVEIAVIFMAQASPSRVRPRCRMSDGAD